MLLGQLGSGKSWAILGGGVLCYNVARWCIRQDTGLPQMLCFQADGDSQFPVSSTLNFRFVRGLGSRVTLSCL
jgi:hypothetical protein